MTADLLEVESKLRKQGTMLCLPVGRSLGQVLKRHGFEPGQSVVLRFGPERMEIRPRNTTEEIRNKLVNAAGDVRAFRERIVTLAKDLPQVTDEELEADETLEGELLGLLECLVADDLDPAIVKLESVAELGPGTRSRKSLLGSEI